MDSLCSSMDPNTLNPDILEPNVLYTFSSIDYIDDLKVGMLWFAPTYTYNDIYEDAIFVRGPKETANSIEEWLKSRVVRCFTADPTNTLMWAHYAKSHTGVCVGFRPSHVFQKTDRQHPGRACLPVRYSSVPPMPFVSGTSSLEEIDAMAQNVMLTKSIHWSYEKEFRAFTNDSALATAGGGLVNIGPDAVVDVIFGADVPKADIEAHRARLPAGVTHRWAQKDTRGISYNLLVGTW